MAELLGRKEMEEVIGLLKNQFGFRNWPSDLGLLRKKDRLWAVARGTMERELSKMNAQVAGVYFGTLEQSGLRLSIEGSQIAGPKCSKNVVEVDEEQLNSWLRGFDLNIEIDSVYALLKHGGDFIGCGKRKRDSIMNTVPKSRRIRKL